MASLKDLSKILREHKNDFQGKYKVSEIGIFGSHVRKEQKADSDVDILVEFDEAPDLFTFIEFEEYLERLLNTKVDLVQKKALRPQLKKNILEEVVYV